RSTPSTRIATEVRVSGPDHRDPGTPPIFTEGGPLRGIPRAIRSDRAASIREADTASAVKAPPATRARAAAAMTTGRGALMGFRCTPIPVSGVRVASIVSAPGRRGSDMDVVLLAAEADPEAVIPALPLLPHSVRVLPPLASSLGDLSGAA